MVNHSSKAFNGVLRTSQATLQCYTPLGATQFLELNDKPMVERGLSAAKTDTAACCLEIDIIDLHHVIQFLWGQHHHPIGRCNAVACIYRLMALRVEAVSAT